MTGAPAHAHTREAWPEAELERVERCPACESEARDRLHSGLTDPLFGAPGAWTLWRCRSCGSAFLDPRPTPEAAGRAYASYFTHEEPHEPEPAGAIGRLRRRALHGYLEARYGYELGDGLGWAARLLPLVPRTVALTDRWVRHVHRRGGSPRVLDVGCGNGVYLLRMRSLGFEAHGIDVDPAAVEEAQAAGLDVRRGGLADLDGAERFDAITLGHVIEHLPDPLDALRRARELLAPGGMVWVATPNVGALAHSVFGPSWYAIDAPRHLVLFSARALGDLLGRAGFERVERLATPPGAVGAFGPSAAIAGGLNPLERTPPLPRGQRLRATLADLLHSRRPDRAEELIFAGWAAP